MEIYIFIAKNHEEFERYPGEGDGFFVDKSFRLPYRYNIVSKEALIVVIDSFGEKDIIKEQQHNNDNFLRCLIVISALTNKIISSLDISNDNLQLHIFIHFGGIEFSVAESIAGEMKKEKIMEEFYEFCNEEEYKEKITKLIPNYNVYAISSTDPQKRLSLGNDSVIELPRTKESLEKFRNSYDQNIDELKILMGFDNKWNIDNLKAKDQEKAKEKKTEYYKICKNLELI